jgi:hypothetical protein
VRAVDLIAGLCCSPELAEEYAEKSLVGEDGEFLKILREDRSGRAVLRAVVGAIADLLNAVRKRRNAAVEKIAGCLERIVCDQKVSGRSPELLVSLLRVYAVAPAGGRQRPLR